MLTEEEKKALEEASKKIEEKRKELKSHVKINTPLSFKVMGWSILRENYIMLKMCKTLEEALLIVKDYQYYGKCCYIDIIDVNGNKTAKVNVI